MARNLGVGVPGLNRRGLFTGGYLIGRCGKTATSLPFPTRCDRSCSMRKALICVALIALVAWLWPSSMRQDDLTGVWVADEDRAGEYKLWFFEDGNLEAYRSTTTGRLPDKPTFKMGWRIGRKGTLILIFTPRYVNIISRFFGIPAEDIRNGLKGNQIVFERVKDPIYVKGERIGKIQTLQVRPLYGLKFRFEDNDSRGPEKLMIGKRVFAQTWGTG